MAEQPTYELFYWPMIQGRGEYVRLIFEDAGLPYVDVARLPEGQGGIRALRAILDDARGVTPPFAPPVLRAGGLLISQTGVICRYVARAAGLLPADEAQAWAADHLMHTIMDHVLEAHDTHHPVGSGLYYEEQQEEARRRTAFFLEQRLPKLMDYYERVLQSNAAGKGNVLVGATASYVDLGLFQLVAGLRYAFPNAMAAAASSYPRVMALHRAVESRPGIAAYLASERRIPFNEHGIFRHYPELDAPA